MSMSGLALTTLIIVVLWFMLFSHRYAWWRKTVDWSAPRILMYHMISPHQKGAKFNKMRVTPTAFAMQIKWLADNGFTFLTMQELFASRHKLMPKSVVLTFDDGFADNYHNALPILQQHHAKATIYVVVDRHNRDWDTYKKAHHNTGELAKEPKLTDAELIQLVNSGLVEIGSHTLTHVNLNKTDDETRLQEITVSKAKLAELCKQPIDSFAYPFGLYSHADITVAIAAGYHHAVTVTQGIDNIAHFTETEAWFNLKRIKVSGKDSLYAFKTRLRTGFRGWK